MVFQEIAWLQVAATCVVVGLSGLLSCFMRDGRHKALSGQLLCGWPMAQDIWTTAWSAALKISLFKTHQRTTYRIVTYGTRRLSEGRRPGYMLIAVCRCR